MGLEAPCFQEVGLHVRRAVLERGIRGTIATEVKKFGEWGWHPYRERDVRISTRRVSWCGFNYRWSIYLEMETERSRNAMEVSEMHDVKVRGWKLEVK